MKQWKYQWQKVRCEPGKKLHDIFLKDGKIVFFLCLLINDHDHSTHTVDANEWELKCIQSKFRWKAFQGNGNNCEGCATKGNKEQ